MDNSINKVAVLGAGTMGAQIAGHFSNAGIPSLLFDINTELATKGVETLTALRPAPLYTPKNTDMIDACTYDKDLEKIKDVDLVQEDLAFCGDTYGTGSDGDSNIIQSTELIVSKWH